MTIALGQPAPRAGRALVDAIHNRLMETDIAGLRDRAVSGVVSTVELQGLRFAITSPMAAVGEALSKRLRLETDPSQESDLTIAVLPFDAPEANLAVLSPERVTVASVPVCGDVSYVTREFDGGRVKRGVFGPYGEADGFPGAIETEPWEWADSVLALVEMEMVHLASRRQPAIAYIHGGSLHRDGRGVLISGNPGVGKTTLSLALTSGGFALLNDDVSCVDLETGRLHAYARAPHIRAPSLGLLEPLLDRTAIDAVVAQTPRRASAEATEPTARALFFLDGFADAPELTPITHADARTLILPQLLASPPGPVGEIFIRLARFVGTLDCYRLRVGPPAQTVRAICDCLDAGARTPL